MEVQKKVTRKELDDMHIGQTRIIHLVSENKIDSARQTVRQVSYLKHKRFKFVPDLKAVAVSITRTE